MNRTVNSLIKELKRFPENSTCYIGCFSDIVICLPDETDIMDYKVIGKIYCVEDAGEYQETEFFEEK